MSRRRSDPLVTNEGVALAFLCQEPRAELSEIAAAAGVEQRTAQRLIERLEAAGYLTRVRMGRAVEYTVHLGAPLVRPGLTGTVGDYLTAIDSHAASEVR